MGRETLRDRREPVLGEGVRGRPGRRAAASARDSTRSTSVRMDRRTWVNALSASGPTSPNSVHHQASVPELTTTSGSTVTPRA